MKKQTAAAGKSKAKKATAGARIAVATWKEIGSKGWNSRPDLQSRIDRAIAAAVRKAVKAERERCVAALWKYADGSDCDREIWTCQQCIDAIRKTNP